MDWSYINNRPKLEVDTFYTVPEVTLILALRSDRVLCRAIKAGELKHHRIGKSVRILGKEVQLWLERGASTGESQTKKGQAERRVLKMVRGSQPDTEDLPPAS